MLRLAEPQVVGYRETAKALREVEPKLQRQLTSTMRKAAQPLQRGVQALVPSAPPMSGWSRTRRYPFDPGAARAGVKVRTGGRASSRRAVWPLLSVVQRDASGAVFDMAGRRSSGHSPQGRAFIRILNERFGHASRSLWPGVEENIDTVRAEVLAAIDQTAAQINRTIDRRRW